MMNGTDAINYLDIASAYLQELQHQRNDIVAAYVAGSVARGQATDLSDIDLVVLIDGEVDAALGRGGIDGWCNGIYLDAVLLAQERFADLESWLQDAIKSGQLRDAVILYDPTTFLAQQQQALRTLFFEPQWVHARQTDWGKRIQPAFLTLCDGVSATDPLRICAGMGWFTFSYACTTLLHAGIAPRSTWTLTQLAAVAPAIRARLLALMSATPVSATEVIALEPFLLETAQLLGVGWGQYPSFYVPKTIAMAKQGHHEAALQALWLMMAIIADICLQSDDAALKIKGAELLQYWLQQVGFATAEQLVVNVQLAEVLMTDVAQLSADF